MQVAVIRNTPQAKTLRRFGRQNREFYREEDIVAVRDALVEAGHAATILEADVTLFQRLEALVDAARSEQGADPPLFVYNLAYGVQGDCRYTHTPSMLELAGLPYVGSGPRAHTLSLDKHLTKVLLRDAGLPTPPFALLTAAGEPLGDISWPVIVKPQFESTSFGLQLASDRAELDAAVAEIVGTYRQPALVEQYVEGTEVNCGLLGNDPPRPLPVLEVAFDEGVVPILTYQVKRDRVARHICPARIPPETAARVQSLAVAVFEVLGCVDCGRVDFRIDARGEPQILEMNSMVALHGLSSYFDAARAEGMSFAELVNLVFDAAVRRYRSRAATPAE